MSEEGGIEGKQIIPADRALIPLPDQQLLSVEQTVNPDIRARYEALRQYTDRMIQTVAAETDQIIAQALREKPEYAGQSAEQLKQIIHGIAWNCYFSREGENQDEHPFDAVFSYSPLAGESWNFSKTSDPASTLIVSKNFGTGTETVATHFFDYKPLPNEQTTIDAWFEQGKTEVSMVRDQDGTYSTGEEPKELAETILLNNLRAATDFFEHLGEYSANVNFELSSRFRHALQLHFQQNAGQNTPKE